MVRQLFNVMASLLNLFERLHPHIEEQATVITAIQKGPCMLYKPGRLGANAKALIEENKAPRILNIPTNYLI